MQIDRQTEPSLVTERSISINMLTKMSKITVLVLHCVYFNDQRHKKTNFKLKCIISTLTAGGIVSTITLLSVVNII